MTDRSSSSKVFASLGDVVTDFHSSVLYARNKLIRERPELVQKFVDGWLKKENQTPPAV